MNLIIKDGLGKVKDSISQICESVKYVRNSPTRAQVFEKYIKNEGILYKGFVCHNVPTRWKFTYLILDVVIKFNKSFSKVGRWGYIILHWNEKLYIVV